MSSQSSSSQGARSRWGRARFGGGSAALIATSALAGLALSSGIGALFAVLGGNKSPWMAFGVVAVMTLPVAIALFWTTLVDRSSIQGATLRPEESVENIWYNRAAVGAFGDLIMMMGLGCGGFALTRITVAPDLLLMGLFALTAADFGLRYRLLKKADS